MDLVGILVGGALAASGWVWAAVREWQRGKTIRGQQKTIAGLETGNFALERGIAEMNARVDVAQEAVRREKRVRRGLEEDIDELQELLREHAPTGAARQHVMGVLERARRRRDDHAG